MYFDFANVLVFLLLGLFLSAMMLGLGRLLRPSNPLVPKLATYECGEPPTGSAWINFKKSRSCIRWWRCSATGS